jgi:hypothetical protein
MATDFQKEIAGKVFDQMVKEHLTSFDEKRYSQILYPLLTASGVIPESRTYHWRAIKPLVEKKLKNHRSLVKQHELEFAESWTK